MEFLILLSQSHPNFRIPELESLADLYNIKLEVTNYLEEVNIPVLFCIARFSGIIY